VEQTLLDARPGEVTEVTRLPPPVEDAEATVERTSGLRP
jgi:hypothetical protein